MVTVASLTRSAILPALSSAPALVPSTNSNQTAPVVTIPHFFMAQLLAGFARYAPGRIVNSRGGSQHWEDHSNARVTLVLHTTYREMRRLGSISFLSVLLESSD